MVELNERAGARFRLGQVVIATSDNDRLWVVMRYEDGEWWCTNGGWSFSKHSGLAFVVCKVFPDDELRPYCRPDNERRAVKNVFGKQTNLS